MNDNDHEIDELARELESVSLEDETRERVLANVLSAGGPPLARARRWGPIALVALVSATAAAAVTLVVASSPETKSVIAAAPVDPPIAPIYRAAVRADAGARFEHKAAPDEVVRVLDGVVTIDVAPLQSGERFRVIASDAEIEGIGSFVVVASHTGTLASVQVMSGRIDVRPAQRATTVVIAGQRWEAPIVATRETAVEEIEPPKRTSASNQPIQPIPPSPPPIQIIESPPPTLLRALPPERPMAKRFQEGWDRLRAGDARAAIASFDEALAIDPNDPIAEDASFWRGVAMQRATRVHDAEVALVAFVEHFPRSSRVGEAAAMIGWLALERGDLVQARSRFAVAAQDPHTSVRESAQRGIAALATRGK